MDWADREEEDLFDQLNDGEITKQEFNQYIKELREEVRESGEYDY